MIIQQNTINKAIVERVSSKQQEQQKRQTKNEESVTVSEDPLDCDELCSSRARLHENMDLDRQHAWI